MRGLIIIYYFLLLESKMRIDRFREPQGEVLCNGQTCKDSAPQIVRKICLLTRKCSFRQSLIGVVAPFIIRQLPLARKMFANEIWFAQPFASVNFVFHAHTPYKTAWMVFLAPCSAWQYKDPISIRRNPPKKSFLFAFWVRKRAKRNGLWWHQCRRVCTMLRQSIRPN